LLGANLGYDDPFPQKRWSPLLAEHEFVSILKQNIRPAQPIDVPELLQGREPILRKIRRTLHSPGMHDRREIETD
jgi:hypothetical protein